MMPDILCGIRPGRVVVVGIGNTLRADDGAGSLVAQRLAERHPGLVFDAAQTPENFLAPVRRAEPATVVLVDAADFGGEPGELREVVAGEVRGLMLDTHAAPLSMFMKMLALETGADVRLVAVQAVTAEFGGEVSPAVTAAVERLTETLDRILSRP